MTGITVLAGGVGGARFIRGLLSQLADEHPSADGPGSTVPVTVIANTGDDMWLTGLRICPDLDTIMYTLGGGVAEDQGWGRADETRRTSGEIAAYGAGWDWFTLGDLDLATHIVRSDLLRSGRTLSEATEILTRRWQPGVRLLPMSDDPVETNVRLAADIDEHRAGDLIHFEEWWVRYRASAPATEFVQVGLEQAEAAPGVLEAIRDAEVVIIPPSNPVVSIGTILAIPGVRAALHDTDARVVGVSPIIGGRVVRGMADRCLDIVGVESTALGVGLFYGSRAAGGLLDAWLVDETDAGHVAALQAAGIRASAHPLWMHDVETTAAIASHALRAAHPESFDRPTIAHLGGTA